MTPRRLEFIFSDGVTHDASVSEVSEAIELCFDHSWSLVPEVSGLDANPTWTLEVSNDNATWNPYEAPTEDAAIDQGFDDHDSAFLYWRINYNAQTNTTGTVTFPIIIKKH